MKDKWDILSFSLKNSIIMTCWTVLAIHFDRWWIALFAALFLAMN